MTQPHYILLVDDQPKGLEALEFRLQRAGYRTAIAHNGELGLQSARKDMPHAVILDLTMPELNGYQTCRELKKMKSDLPVVIFTAKTDPADRFWALECGADEFVTKPADPAAILQLIEKLLQR